MKIKKILSQHRRDFQAVYECEHCKAKKTSHGYDDANFHNNVIPAMKCRRCGKTSSDEYSPLTTKYAEGVTI